MITLTTGTGDPSRPAPGWTRVAVNAATGGQLLQRPARECRGGRPGRLQNRQRPYARKIIRWPPTALKSTSRATPNGWKWSGKDNATQSNRSLAPEGAEIKPSRKYRPVVSSDQAQLDRSDRRKNTTRWRKMTEDQVRDTPRPALAPTPADQADRGFYRDGERRVIPRWPA